VKKSFFGNSATSFLEREASSIFYLAAK